MPILVTVGIRADAAGLLPHFHDIAGVCNRDAYGGGDQRGTYASVDGCILGAPCMMLFGTRETIAA